MSIPATFHDLNGKSVFITGGGSGIGASLTDGFLAQGAKVAFVQRSDASEFCDEMEAKHGVRPLFIPCDITDMAALKSAIDHAAETHGAIEVLVNNAANDKRHAVEDVTEEFWDWMQAINLKAYFFAAQAVVPAMKAAGKGTIINFTSISYMMGNAGYPLYTTANAGLNGMTRSLARDLGASNIRVNALAPGFFLSEMTDEYKPGYLDSQMPRVVLGRTGEPVELAATAVWLASRAGGYVVGQTIAVDGGLTIC